MATYAFHCGTSVKLNRKETRIKCGEPTENLAVVSPDDIPIGNLGDITGGDNGIDPESGGELVADLTALISTFDVTTFETVITATLMGLAVGWAGGFIINAIYKGRKI